LGEGYLIPKEIPIIFQGISVRCPVFFDHHQFASCPHQFLLSFHFLHFEFLLSSFFELDVGVSALVAARPSYKNNGLSSSSFGCHNHQVKPVSLIVVWCDSFHDYRRRCDGRHGNDNDTQLVHPPWARRRQPPLWHHTGWCFVVVTVAHVSLLLLTSLLLSSLQRVMLLSSSRGGDKDDRCRGREDNNRHCKTMTAAAASHGVVLRCRCRGTHHCCCHHCWGGHPRPRGGVHPHCTGWCFVVVAGAHALLSLLLLSLQRATSNKQHCCHRLGGGQQQPPPRARRQQPLLRRRTGWCFVVIAGAHASLSLPLLLLGRPSLSSLGSASSLHRVVLCHRCRGAFVVVFVAIIVAGVCILLVAGECILVARGGALLSSQEGMCCCLYRRCCCNEQQATLLLSLRGGGTTTTAAAGEKTTTAAAALHGVVLCCCCRGARC
jgi:hypothetical protein